MAAQIFGGGVEHDVYAECEGLQEVGGEQGVVYGDDGPGYIFYGPEEGFQAGEYALEVWVNGELLTAATAVMNSSAALSAGN